MASLGVLLRLFRLGKDGGGVDKALLRAVLPIFSRTSACSHAPSHSGREYSCFFSFFPFSAGGTGHALEFSGSLPSASSSSSSSLSSFSPLSHLYRNGNSATWMSSRTIQFSIPLYRHFSTATNTADVSKEGRKSDHATRRQRHHLHGSVFFGRNRKPNQEDIGYRVTGQLDAGTEPVEISRPTSFAVVQVGSHQFKVAAGDVIYTEKLNFVDVNDKVELHKVMMLGSKSCTVIGRPILPGLAVVAAVEEHALDAKVIIFKKRRRKNYRRTKGHRQELTRLRILDVPIPEESALNAASSLPS